MAIPKSRQMHLAAFCGQPGNHIASWRHPLAATNAILDPSFYQNVAQIAERGLFDLVFLADILALTEPRSAEQQTIWEVPFRIDPLTVLPVMAAATERVGLAATASTSYNEPFNIARRFGLLDHLSRGRIGWNIVTTASEPEARNFEATQKLSHNERYARATEFVEVTKKLWDSWSDDALIADKDSGAYADRTKIRTIDHVGTYFNVRGPLNLPRSPQGRPVLFQAGTSRAGREFAARTADAVFLAAQTREEAAAVSSAIRAIARQNGRTDDSIRFLPGVLVFIGRTTEEARRKQDELNGLLGENAGTALLTELLNIDLSGFPPDCPFPELDLSAVTGIQSRYRLLKDMADRDNLTLRQVTQRVASGAGHRIVVGDPRAVADQLEDWFVSGAVDGYTLMFPYLPGSLAEFVELVVPVLQERGLFRTVYEGHTLRDHLGLERPARA
ncbi:LLM class flavin-dependent oxidoreductase [Mesorhizobium retamae]|uniref:LLM class flavin-dependent oxidoreductase n=1 Tax=Mesorhizobium retamae TaxID=2912854 RepID=A0ABS9QD68_9HYPH|nr:LLM class flavin-dependent oxidoreductase [Mesorhizobium sp. IRAMC:0171]MCG7505357.1 LLM class flavin-dependent oxidoreductase [Mesorhizobium sp. IRAMC:0171]